MSLSITELNNLHYLLPGTQICTKTRKRLFKVPERVQIPAVFHYDVAEERTVQSVKVRGLPVITDKGQGQCNVLKAVAFEPDSLEGVMVFIPCEMTKAKWEESEGHYEVAKIRAKLLLDAIRDDIVEFAYHSHSIDFKFEPTWLEFSAYTKDYDAFFDELY